MKMQSTEREEKLDENTYEMSPHNEQEAGKISDNKYQKPLLLKCKYCKQTLWVVACWYAVKL